jgi:transposase
MQFYVQILLDYLSAIEYMYENCVKKGQNLTWLSRVPATNKLCIQALAMKDITWTQLSTDYKMYVLEKEDAPKDLHWILFFSQEAYKREIKTLEKNILEDLELAKKTAKSLEREEFSCEKDILKYIKKSVSKIKFHTLFHTVESVGKHSLPGRPSKDSKPDLIVYKVTINIEENKKAIESATLSKGKFILATNAEETKLKNEDFLCTYKKQSSVESGFKFIKDNTFEVDSVFVKKPGRVSALMVIMVLTLLIYRLAEYKLRKKLIEEKKTVGNQKNKQISNPTMKWICKLFYGVSLVNIKLNGQSKSFVMNMNEELKKIARLFGEYACQLYGIEYEDG